MSSAPKVSRGRGAPLSQREVETLGPGLHHDGNGLYLSVSETRRRWVMRYTHPTLTVPKPNATRPGQVVGKRVEMGMGTPWIDKKNPGGVRLADVRKQVAEAHELLAKGIDPLAERNRIEAEKAAEAAKAPPKTFGEFAEELMDGKLSNYRNEKHKAQWRTTLSEKYVKPIWNKPPAEITTEDVLAVLKPLWTKTPETASRLRGRIEFVLDAAGAIGLRDRNQANPARWGGHLETILPERTKASKRHQPALRYEDAPALIAELRKRDGIAARAVEFLILTAARSGEVRGMTWAELNEDRSVWTVPAGRMKAEREHRVPLTARAREILAEMDQLRAEERPAHGLVFPGQGSKLSKTKNPPLSDMTLGAVLKRMRKGEGAEADLLRKLLQDKDGNEVVVHGFRSTFRDWAEDKAGFPARLIEHALAHTIKNKAEAAYRRGDALEQRVELMSAWAEYLAGAPTRDAKVIPMRARRG